MCTQHSDISMSLRVCVCVCVHQLVIILLDLIEKKTVSFGLNSDAIVEGGDLRGQQSLSQLLVLAHQLPTFIQQSFAQRPATKQRVLDTQRSSVHSV